MNRCNMYWSLSPYLDALLWCLYFYSQARSSQWRRFRVALPKLLIVCKIYIYKLFVRLQSRDINGMSPNLLKWRWQFFFLAEKKKNKKSSVRMWTCIYRIQWCTVRMHNALARTGLETNSSGDISLRKEKAPLLLWVYWLKKSSLMICFHLLSCRCVYETFALVKGKTPLWRVVSERRLNFKEKKNWFCR